MIEDIGHPPSVKLDGMDDHVPYLTKPMYFLIGYLCAVAVAVCGTE
jgi:hypothetical protein